MDCILILQLCIADMGGVYTYNNTTKQSGLYCLTIVMIATLHHEI